MKLIKQFQDGKLEALPGRSEDETLELKIIQILNKARNEAGDIAIATTPHSNSIDMLKSGARGNALNIAQMSALVGQQAVHGSRVVKGYTNRTLSCFKDHDRSALARGFIRNSFKEGMKPYETFFMAMTGRDALMDTALRTPKSGYLYRRLANAMQDLKIDYDFTVRDASGKIVQFNYGEDGIDVAKSEGGQINVKRIVADILDN